MMNQLTARTMVLSAAAVGAVLLFAHGARLSRDAALTGEASLPLWLLTPAAHFGESTGIDRGLQNWSAARDRWYETEPDAAPVAEVAAAAAQPDKPLPGPKIEPGTGDASGVAGRESDGSAAPDAKSSPRREIVERPERPQDTETLKAPPEQERPTLLGGGGTTPVSKDGTNAVIRRVLIIGASSIEGSLGIELERKLERIEGLTVRRWGRHSTGLARPDYFDWLEKTRGLAAAFRPDLVIAQLGGNDGQGITRANGSVVAQLNSKQWEDHYATRMREFAGVVSAAGSKLVYVGMPIPRDEVTRRRMARANRASKTAVEASGQLYLSSWAMTADEQGGYLKTITLGGRERGLRASDGFHLSTVGSDYVAGRIVGYLRTGFTLPDEIPASVAPISPEPVAPEPDAAPAPPPEASGGP